MMKSEGRNSERNKELKAFKKDGKQVIGRRVGGKEKKLFSQLFKEGLQKKKQGNRGKQTDLHKQGLQNVVSYCHKQVKMSTISWTAEFIYFPIAVTYYSFHIILYANMAYKYVYYVLLNN
jgi:hypothetical protein